jgi:hypothetical protein
MHTESNVSSKVKKNGYATLAGSRGHINEYEKLMHMLMQSTGLH